MREDKILEIVDCLRADPASTLLDTHQKAGGRSHTFFWWVSWKLEAASTPTIYPAVLKMILNFVLGPPSPGRSRGKVRTAISLGKSKVRADYGPNTGGIFILDFDFGLKQR